MIPVKIQRYKTYYAELSLYLIKSSATKTEERCNSFTLNLDAR